LADLGSIESYNEFVQLRIALLRRSIKIASSPEKCTPPAGIAEVPLQIGG
jgi:hypothetical protein